jgi:hypothetical protein
MSTMKDYIKIIVTVVITFLATSFLNAVINKTNATQTDLIEVKTEAFTYTDKCIIQHEKVQAKELENLNSKITSMDNNITDIKEMTGKLLDMQLNK